MKALVILTCFRNGIDYHDYHRCGEGMEKVSHCRDVKVIIAVVMAILLLINTC